MKLKQLVNGEQDITNTEIHNFDLGSVFISRKKKTGRKKNRKSTFSKNDDFEGKFGFYFAK